MISLCCTVTNRQDLLPGMLRSAFAGTVKPDRVYIVDQRASSRALSVTAAMLRDVTTGFTVIDLKDKRGCEASAVNWYLTNVREERVIAHEDVIFGADSLERFLSTPGDFLIDDSMGVITYRNRCFRLIGNYDVTISPNYFHYVDVDYEDRLAMAGIHPVVVPCGIDHLRNGTMKGFTPEQLAEYKVRDEIARVNYEALWNRPVTPGGDTIGRAQWRQSNDISGWRAASDT